MSQSLLDPSGSTTSSPDPGRDRRWAQLTEAICVMGRELSVQGRLEQTVQAAAETTSARFATVILYHRVTGRPEQVLHSVRTPEDVEAATGALRRLGAPYLESAAAALAALADPTEQPDRLDFLVVPIHTGLGLYGVICVSEPVAVQGFAADDRNLLASLADTTGVGVDCATAFEESERRGDWLSASATITQQLLTLSDGLVGTVQQIADHVLRLAGAATVTIVVPSPDDPGLLEVRIAAGLGADQLAQRSYPAAGSVAQAAILADAGQLRGADDLYCPELEVVAGAPVLEVLAVPFGARKRAAVGAVVATRRSDQPAFAEADVRMTEDFARQAGLALELAEARITAQQLQIERERELAARTLRDDVLQRLFSIGLQVRTAEPTVTDEAARTRLNDVLEAIDATIREVRASRSPSWRRQPALSRRAGRS